MVSTLSETTLNFEFLRRNHPELHKHMIKAEKFVHSEPTVCIIKLRCFAEMLVADILKKFHIDVEETDNFYQRLTNSDFSEVVEHSIIKKLHAIRVKGNKAAHGSELNEADSKWLLKEAFLVASWYVLTTRELVDSELPNFQLPPPSQPDNTSDDSSERALSAAKAELKALEEQHKKTQQELSETRDELRQKRDLFSSRSKAVIGRMSLEDQTTRANLKLTDHFSEYSLTADQTNLVRALEDFIAGKSTNTFLLRGYAGTGKTFIIKGLTEYLRLIGRNFVVAAPTGKAAKVINKKANVDAYTIHRTIYSMRDIKQYKEEELDGSETYKFYADLTPNEYSADTIFIVDEASMIADCYQESEFFRFGSGFLLSDLMKFVNIDHNDHQKKMIFIGDNAQLPPVGMNRSPALDMDYLGTKFNLSCADYELVEIVRQREGSGVLANASMLRQQLEAHDYSKLDFDTSAPNVDHIEYSEFITRYLELNGTAVSDDTMVVCGSNSDVADFNQRIREELFPDCTELQPKEKLLVVQNTEIDGQFISNGEFIYVTNVSSKHEARTIPLKRKKSDGSVEVTQVPLQFRRIEFALRDEAGLVLRFEKLIIESLLFSKEGTLTSDENKALYVDFCMRRPELKQGSLEFKNHLRSDPYFNALRVKFGYAITAHKAQGSEWRNVFVKCSAPQFSSLTEGYFRWLYTAITRTSEKLLLLDEPHIKVGTGIKKVGANITDLESQLEALKHKSETIIKSFGANIESVQHLQFLERFHIQLNEGHTGSIDLYYNKNGEVTRVRLLRGENTFAPLVKALEGLQFANINAGADDIESYQFDQPFLRDFHDRLSELVTPLPVHITNLKSLSFEQRYTLADDEGGTITLKFYYNGKRRFTKFDALPNFSINPELKNQLMNAIEQGFGDDGGINGVH